MGSNERMISEYALLIYLSVVEKAVFEEISKL